ncbi:MAG: SHOCT domain-containing protein [Polyangiaceae bacterium]
MCDSIGGLNAIWWAFSLSSLFVLAGFVMLVAFGVPIRRARWRGRDYRDSTPLVVLQRRYAAGAISTEEYKERKATLESPLVNNSGDT